MKKKKTIGERIDAVVWKASDKVETARGKIVTAKKEAAGIAHDISKSVKKAVGDTGAAVSNLLHKKE